MEQSRKLSKGPWTVTNVHSLQFLGKIFCILAASENLEKHLADLLAYPSSTINSVMSLDSPSSMISGSPGRKISTVPRTKFPLPYLERNRKIVGCLSCKEVCVLVTMMTGSGRGRSPQQSRDIHFLVV